MRSLVVLGLLSSLAVAQPKPPPMRSSLWLLHGLSLDGKRALLQELPMQGGGLLRYKVIEADTNKVVEDVTFPALSSMPLETFYDSGKEIPGAKANLSDPKLITDLQNIHRVLDGFALGAGNRIAASKDGATVAINVGDLIHSASVDQTKGTVLGGPIAKEASYGAWFTPDGSIMFRKWNGKVTGDIVGKYELFTVPVGVPNATPVRIDQTAGVHDQFVFDPARNVARFIATSEPQIQTCVVEVSVVKPYKATKKACITGKEHVVNCVLSRHGKWAACTTTKGEDKAQRFRFRTIDVDNNRVAYDSTKTVSATAISDEGIAVIDRYSKTVIVDSQNKAMFLLDAPVAMGSFPVWRSPTELVVERGGSIAVVDASKWKRIPITGDP